MASKGKGIAEKGSSGKRKRGNNDKAGIGGQKKRNRSVLQFFEDSAVEFDAESSDESYEFDDIEDFIDDIDVEPKIKSEPGKFESVRVFPKEEELSGDELEKMLQERYGSGSGYVRYAEDDYDSKRSVDRDILISSAAEPTIWKVKCKVGRERHTVFCLMQKYVDLNELGTKLHIISVFAVEHIKGFVFIEAEKQSDVVEACNQLADVYYSLVTKVPINEVSQLLVVRRRYNEVKEGTWARVKNGIYRGDIAQVVAVNNERKRATIKLIPRVDLQALAGKYGGGATVKKSKAITPARLISARELEEFRPLMQYRRDRDTGKVFEFLDSLMLKDGFLYKKVSFDSLSFWDVNPSEDELQKFAPPSNDASDNLEWLSQLYGEQKERSVNLTLSKGGGKGEGTSGSNEQSSFEVHDLVLFGKRDFGMIMGMEKDDSYKILKNGSDGPVTMNMGQKDLKYVPLDRKFTALDHRTKTISISDTVRIIDGPTKGRQGIVKQIYRGVIFLYDEHDLDNAYFCASSQMSERVKHADSACHGKDEGGPSGLEDVPSSPKSPLSPKKPWQRENNSDDRRNDDGMFSVGQSLRIRVGPLKGYLCRVLAIRRSDVTVKLDSQQKVLTVKREHLSEVRGKISSTSMSEDAGLSSAFKPFELLGAEGSSNDWLQGSSGSANGNGWDVGGLSGERGAWPAFPSAGASVGTSGAADPSSANNDSTKGDDAWLKNIDEKKNSSWGAVGNEQAVGDGGQAGAWGKSDGGWGKSSGTDASSSWGSAKVASGNQGSSWKAGGFIDDQEKAGTWGQADAWDKGKKVTENTGSWSKQSSQEGHLDSWSKGKGAEEPSGWSVNASSGSAGSSGWGKQKASKENETWGDVGHYAEGAVGNTGGNAWNEAKGSGNPVEDAWVKGAGTWDNKSASNECSKWKSSTAASESKAGSWGQVKGQSSSGGWQNNSSIEDSNERWSKQEHASGWGKDTATGQGGSSWNKSGGRSNRDGNHVGRDQFQNGREGGSSSWGQFSSWSKDSEAGSSWGNSSGGNHDQGSNWGTSDSERDGKGWSQRRESSETSTWGLAKGTSGGNGPPDNGAAGGEAWTNAKDKGGLAKDSWGNKNSSDESSGWKSSGAASESQAGGWGQAQGEKAPGGWKNKSSNGNWGKQESTSDWEKVEAVSQGGSSWSKSGADAWGEAKDKSDLAKDSCGNKNNSDGSGGWKSSKAAPAPPAGSWGQAQGESASGGWKKNSWNDRSNGNQGKQESASDWGKGGAASQGGSSWNKSGCDAWGQAKDSSDRNTSGENSGCNSSKAASASQAGGWGQVRGESASGGWKKNNSWNDRSNGDWGKQENGSDWGKGGATSQGGSSWSKSGSFESWDKSGNADNNQGNGGRGFGGRRGRDGNRGGRFGRGRGGSFGQGQSSSWSKENQAEHDQGYGGRGFGGRRGRDGHRGGRFGRGRGGSFGQGQSSSWSKENQAGSSWGCASGGNEDQGSGWGNRKDWSGGGNQGQSSSWSKENQAGSSWGCASGGNGDQGSSWGHRKGCGSDSGAEGKESGKQSEPNEKSSWSSQKGTSGGNQSPEGGSWLKKVDENQNSSWGAPSDVKAAGDSKAWVTSDGGWGKGSGSVASNSWGSAKHDGKSGGSWKAGGSNVDQDKEGTAGQTGSWDVKEKLTDKENNWGKQSAQGHDSWNKAKDAGEASRQGSGW